MPLDDAARAWIARWARLAEGDLAMARLGLENHDFDVYELVGFHAQQAVEKFIKAFLARNAVDFEDQHDIDYLQRLVRKVDSDLGTRIDPAASLNRYAVGTRYPGRYGPVTREQAAAAVRIAEQVRADIQPLLGEAPNPRGSLRERLRRQRRRVVITRGTAMGQTQPDPDSRVVEVLRTVGADLRQPTEFIVFLSESLGGKWGCIGTRQMVPDPEAIAKLRFVLQRLAEEHGGEYDGWEAAVQPYEA